MKTQRQTLQDYIIANEFLIPLGFNPIDKIGFYERNGHVFDLTATNTKEPKFMIGEILRQNHADGVNSGVELVRKDVKDALGL
jgi:hypothetical protein